MRGHIGGAADLVLVARNQHAVPGRDQVRFDEIGAVGDLLGDRVADRLDALVVDETEIAQLGLETNNLAVKLLFRAGSATDFWPGRDYADVYPIWIRQLARAMQASGSCLNVVGHTSRSGSEAVNDRLSLQRAETVKRLLETSVRTLAARLKASGVGYRENIIGTGSDDERDAIDRRVEFKVVDCPR